MLARQANARVFVAILAASLLLTGIAANLFCGPPSHLLRSWVQVVALALAYTCFMFSIHAAVVWSACEVLYKQLKPLPRPIWELWSWTVWVPVLDLLAGEQSIWVVLVLPCMAAGLAVSLKQRTAPGPDDARWPASSLRSVSSEPDARPFLVFLLPVLFTALAVELSVAMLAARNDWMAGFLLAFAVSLPAWRLARRSGNHASEQLTWPRVMNSALAMLVLTIALVPFVPGAAMGLDINVALKRRPDSDSPPVVQAHARTSGSGYSGIVLLLPPKPPEKKIASPVALATVPTATAKPIVIPFNGAYWYLKESEDRPGPDAPVVRGDPLKAKVHSTNTLPVIMKAHQKLPESMDVTCCRSLQIDLTNADKRRGEIMVMVSLGDEKSHFSVPLGVQVLPSSRQPLRAPAHESLTFPILHSKSLRHFDELTVQIRTIGDRQLVGTQVSVDGFLFQP